MERLADMRENFRVNIRKKQHESMLHERRMLIIHDSGPRLPITAEQGEALQAAIHKLLTVGSIEDLQAIRKLSCRSHNLQVLALSEDVAARACCLMAPQFDYTVWQRESAWLLANLSSNKQFAEGTANKLRVGEIMLRRITLPQDTATKDSCLWTINNLLVNNPQLKRWLLQHDIIKYLLSTLKQRLKDNEIATLLTTIIRLVGDKQQQPLPYAMFRPFNKSLFQLLNTSEYESNKLALLCLSMFVNLDPPEIFITDLRMSKIFKKLMTVAPKLNEDRSWYSLLTLMNTYASNLENIAQLIKQGAFSAIESILKGNSPRLMDDALRIVKCMIVNKQFIARFMEHRIMTTVYELAQQQSGNTRLHSIQLLIHCLNNGQESQQNRVSLMDIAGVLRSYYESQPEIDPYIQRLLEQTLQNTDRLYAR